MLLFLSNPQKINVIQRVKVSLWYFTEYQLAFLSSKLTTLSSDAEYNYATLKKS